MFLSNKLAINNPSKSLKPRSSFLNKQVDNQIRDSILCIPNLINFSKDPEILNTYILKDIISEELYNQSNDEIFSEKQKIKKTVTGKFPTHDSKKQTVKKSTLKHKEDRSETMNRSFVVFEKQQYIDKNASFIRTNNHNDTSDEDFGNRSTVVKPQEIMSKAELSNLINLYEPRKITSTTKMNFEKLNLTSTEFKKSDSNIILPVQGNSSIPKLEMYSNNFRKFATKSWIDDAFDSPREKDIKCVENFEGENELSNFNIHGHKDMLDNISSSPHNFVQQKDKKNDISDDEEDFIYDGRSRHIFSFYSKDNKQPGKNFNKKSTYGNDRTEIETISEHPQENLMNSSHVMENRQAVSFAPKKFVIENCENTNTFISSKYINNSDIKITTENNFELSKQFTFNKNKIQREENTFLKILKGTQFEDISKDVTELPFEINNLNLLEKKKLNQKKINLEGFLLNKSLRNHEGNNLINYLSIAAQSDSKSRDSNKLSDYYVNQKSSTNSSAPSSFSSKFNSTGNIKSEINNKQHMSSFKSVESYLCEKSKNIKDYLTASKHNSNSIDDSSNSNRLNNVKEEKNSRFNRNIYQTTSKLNTQDKANEFTDLKKTILNTYSTSLTTSKKLSKNHTDSSVPKQNNIQSKKDPDDNSSYSSKFKNQIKRNSIIQTNQANLSKQTTSLVSHNEDPIAHNRAESIINRMDNIEEGNKIIASRLNINIKSSAKSGGNIVTNTMPNTMTNFHNYSDFYELKGLLAKEGLTNPSFNEKTKGNIFKSQTQCPQYQQYLVLQKALPYSKYNLDLLPKTKAHDEKEVLYSNIADYQTLNQLINSVKKAYNHQIMTLKKNYNGKGGENRSTSPYHRNEKYKLERKNEKLENIYLNKLYSNSSSNNKTLKNNNYHERKNNLQSDPHTQVNNNSPDAIDENTLIELLEEIKERSNKIQNHFKEKEENLINKIKELNENLKVHQEKEKNLQEEITGWKSKLAFFIEDFRKKNKEDKSEVRKTISTGTGINSNETGINFEEIIREINDDKNKKLSKINICNKLSDEEVDIGDFKLHDLPKIASEKTFSQKYNFKKLKSYSMILKEIGLDYSTFYDGVLPCELEDDLCEECFVHGVAREKIKSISLETTLDKNNSERKKNLLNFFHDRLLQEE